MLGEEDAIAMAFLDWNPDWNTGVTTIDAQHQVLLRHADALFQAILAGGERAQAERTLMFLADYVEYHFRTEEELMAQAGFDGLAAHRAAHDALRAKVAEIAARTAGGGTSSLTADVMDYLRMWLVAHLDGEDRKMAGHLRMVFAPSS